MNEGMLYLTSFIVAYILTLLVYITLNISFDIDLKKNLTSVEDDENGKELFNGLKVLSSKYQLLSNSTIWQMDGSPTSQEKNNEIFIIEWNKTRNISAEPLIIDSLRNILLYKSYNINTYSKSMRGFLIPFIGEPTASVSEIIDKLEFSKLNTIFGENGAENVLKFFQEDLSELLDELQSQSSYKNRRYLNGYIQFITFLVAFIGMMLLIATLLSVSIEKKKMLESISSFNLPPNMDNYSNGQLEESMKGLRTQQSQYFSQLREMLINTVNTFNWRGKEEAEATLNLEGQELRESMESRLGMIKYFAWAVPSIGFIGTVIGISDALGGAHRVIGQTSEFETRGEIQLITGQLAIAFDTTLIALLLSIILVFLIHIISRKEEQLISYSISSLKRELLQKIAPLERANKHRRFNLLLGSLKSHSTETELQSDPFLNLKNHLENELNKTII